MFTREEVLRSPEYWFEEAQNELYRQVVEYMEKTGLNQTQLADKLGVSKGYVSQILKGEFNYTLKKLIEISLAVGKVPQVGYKSVEEVIKEDSKTKESKKRSPINGKLRLLKEKSSARNTILNSDF
jgi:transcriptional regulator with XRE-family HTH domain